MDETLATIYLETSVISYLTARPSRDMPTAVRQSYTREWWDSVDKSLVVTSSLVAEEISKGDPEAAAKRLACITDIKLLEVTVDAQNLAKQLMASNLVPSTEPEDALHIAIATLSRCTYLMTWNFSHFVGPVPKAKLMFALREWGYQPPLFTTPEEFMES
jgi:predicted nucleic acid-binding protein